MLRLNESLVTQRNPASPAAESVRSLRVYIRQHLRERTDGAVLLFTSADKGEGKTVLAANLAASFAQEGKKVVILDANLHHPSLHLVYRLNNGDGLSEYLSGRKEPEQIIHQSLIPELAVITAGEQEILPSELFGNERMQELITSLQQQYDIVILDSPGLLGCTDARILASFASGVVLVAKYGSSKRDAVLRAKQYIDQAGAPVLGIAMNQVR